MRTDLDTTKHDGAPCCVCGDDSTCVEQMAEASRLNDRVFCDACRHDHTTVCPTCEQRVWMKQTVQINGEWKCEPCAKLDPNIAECQMEALRRDEQRDAFNEVRR